MFKRKVYEKLKEWKDQYSNDYAVMLEGARRVGKSTIAEEHTIIIVHPSAIDYGIIISLFPVFRKTFRTRPSLFCLTALQKDPQISRRVFP